MLYDLMRQQSASRAGTLDLQPWTTWAVGALYILAVVSFVLHYRLARRLHVIHAVTVGALRALPRIDAYGLRTTRPGPTNTPMSSLPPVLNTTTLFSFVDMINHIRHVDIALIIIFFVVSLISIIMVLNVFNKLRARRSFLYLELKSTHAVVHVCLMVFPDSTRHYGVLLPSEGVRLSINNYCLFGTLTLNTSEWQIMNTITNRLLKAPRHIRLFPRKISQLRHVMNMEFTTTLFAVHTHEYVFHEPQPSFTLGSTTSLHDANEFV